MYSMLDSDEDRDNSRGDEDDVYDEQEHEHEHEELKKLSMKCVIQLKKFLPYN